MLTFLSTLLLLFSFAHAGILLNRKNSEGDFAVTINGQTFNPPLGQEVKLDNQNTPLTGAIQFRGIHVQFDFNTANFAINNYILTGAPDPLRLVTSPTVIFSSYTFNFSPAALANPRLKSLEVKDEKVVLIVQAAGGEFKIQAKDSAQGGVLQTEPEIGSAAVEMTRILGPTVFYFVNEFTGKINFGNGIDASTDPVNFHEMLLGKDSPEAATQTFQDGTSSKWLIQSGGRVGTVFGEDAVEQGGVGSQCTSQCQNRNRIHGSLPVPPDPTDPDPIPGDDD